jgi:phage-related tail protein
VENKEGALTMGLKVHGEIYHKTLCKTWHKAHSDYEKAYKKAWYKAHPDYCKTWYENNKDHCKNLSKIYHKIHQGHYNAIHIKRLADQEKRTPLWANQKKMQEFYAKAVRLTKKTGVQYDVDHIVPLHGKNVCGFHVETNLQVITRVKNSKKGNFWFNDSFSRFTKEYP